METRKKRKQAGEAAPTSAKVLRTATATGYETNSQFLISLVHTRADQLRVPDNTVFIAERTDKIVDVLRGLLKHNFLSVPVLQKTGRKWYGFIDMADIVSYVVNAFGETLLKTTQDYWVLFDKEEQFRQVTVKDLMRHPLTRRNPFNPVKTGYSLMFVIESLARERDLKRIPVVDDDRQLLNLITQSQLLRFLNENMQNLGSKSLKPVGEIKGVLKDVISITESQIVLDAFKRMSSEHVGGVAVVDETGKLTGALSLRDLKVLAPDTGLFWRLYQPLSQVLPKLAKEYRGERPTTVQYCSATSTLEDVVTMLVNHNIHRVFVVDDNMQPTGVVSLKDVLLEIITK